MKSNALITGLVTALLSSPLVLAQVEPPTPATPATPAVPATPGEEPATPATPAQPDKPKGTKKPEAKKPDARAPRGSGSAKGGDNSIGGTSNPESSQSKLRSRSSNSSDFASFDADGNGTLSREEVSGDSSIRFGDLDRNGDGSISNGEFQAGYKARPPKADAKAPAEAPRKE